MNAIFSSFNSLIDPSSKIPAYLKTYNLPILYSLLAIDFVFISLHTLKSLDYLSGPNFSVTKNFGYGESFMYLNELFIISCFLWLAYKFRRSIFYLWGAVFVYVLLDDSMEVHEKIGYYLGGWIKQHSDIMPEIAKESAEMSSFVLFGIVLFTPILLLYVKAKNRSLKVFTQDLLILFGGLLFFGIGIDFLNIFFATGTFLNGFLGLLEDAGEMVMISMIAWYTWTFVSHGDYVNEKKNAKSTHPSIRKLSVVQDREPLQAGKDQQKSRPAAAQLKNKTA